MGGLGLPELFVILVIVLVLFGAKRIPEIMGGIGKGIKSFKRSLETDEIPETTSPPSPAAGPTPTPGPEAKAKVDPQ
jgi:sec-independent protein translocase protein TatA